MHRIPAIVWQFVLLAIGLLLWKNAAKRLDSSPELDVPLNIMGINRSPYGEVLALAIQGPIDQVFQVSYFGNSKLQEPEPRFFDLPLWKNFSLYSLLAHFEKHKNRSTLNTKISKAHSQYLRRKAENQLRFAYHLDPSQYSNYNSLQFFLTEPGIGTKTILTPAAEAFARETIEYCLTREHDPRPALTAGAACNNLLQLMFASHNNGSKEYNAADMREVLHLLDLSIARYQSLSSEWEKTGNWHLLSDHKIIECEERLDFIIKIRHTAEVTIARIEAEASAHKTSQ